MRWIKDQLSILAMSRYGRITMVVAARLSRLRSGSIACSCLILGSLANAGACGDAVQHSALVVSDTIQLTRLVDLQDDTASVIGAPIWVGETPQGSFYVVDRSDRDVKFYNARGRRMGTIGRSGGGPGEFSSLTAAEFLNDSLLAYDLTRGMATIFSPSGEPARTIRFTQPAPWRLHVVSDSLLLAISHPGQRDNLLRILRRDGSEVSSFFPKPKEFIEFPVVAMNSTVFADSFGDRVYAALFGGDRIFVFSLTGDLITTLQIDVPTLGAIAEANSGKLQRADGTWLQHDMRAIMGIVALADNQVAYQMATYDTKVGTDLVSGGEIVFAVLHGKNLLPIARDSLPAGLFGRDALGRALALGYVRDIEGRYFIGRLAARGN